MPKPDNELIDWTKVVWHPLLKKFLLRLGQHEHREIDLREGISPEARQKNRSIPINLSADGWGPGEDTILASVRESADVVLHNINERIPLLVNIFSRDTLGPEIKVSREGRALSVSMNGFNERTLLHLDHPVIRINFNPSFENIFSLVWLSETRLIASFANGGNSEVALFAINWESGKYEKIAVLHETTGTTHAGGLWLSSKQLFVHVEDWENSQEAFLVGQLADLPKDS